MLVEVDRGRYARGADHDDAVGAVDNVPVDELSEAREVEPAVLLAPRFHRGDDCHQASGDHGALRFSRFYLVQYDRAARKGAGSSPVSAARHTPAQRQSASAS